MKDDRPAAGERPVGGRPGRDGRLPGALLVLGGLLLAAAALRPPDGGLLGPPTAGPVRMAGLVMLIAVGAGILIGRSAVRFREEARHLAGPTPWVERLREAAAVLLPGAAVAVPLLALILRGRGGVGPAAPPEPLPTALPTDLPATGPPPAVLPVGREHAQDAGGPVTWILMVGYAVLGLVALAGLVLLLMEVWRRLAVRRGRRAPGLLPAAPPRPEDALAAAVATGRRALTGEDARAAVIACYAAMEGSLSASGVSRRASENPTELLERAVADHLVDRLPAQELTALFREARYSTHPMEGSHVQRAQTALDALAAGLATRAAGPEDVPAGVPENVPAGVAADAAADGPAGAPEAAPDTTGGRR